MTYPRPSPASEVEGPFDVPVFGEKCLLQRPIRHGDNRMAARMEHNSTFPQITAKLSTPCLTRVKTHPSPPLSIPLPKTSAILRCVSAGRPMNRRVYIRSRASDCCVRGRLGNLAN